MLEDNLGVATGHNRGISVATEEGFPFVLMDQGSLPAPDMIACLQLGYEMASRDGMEGMIHEVARSDLRIRLVRQAENVGLVRNFSACIAAARGEYIKFLCDDDVLGPECMAKLMDAVSRAAVALAACARKLVDDDLRPICVAATRSRASLIDGETMTRELFARGNTIGEPTAVLFRRIDGARGFDVRYEYAFDLEMWCHLLRRGALAFVPAPLCSIRIHSAQATRRNIGTGRIIEDKQRFFREMLPVLAGGSRAASAGYGTCAWPRASAAHVRPAPALTRCASRRSSCMAIHAVEFPPDRCRSRESLNKSPVYLSEGQRLGARRTRTGDDNEEQANDAGQHRV